MAELRHWGELMITKYVNGRSGIKLGAGRGGMVNAYDGWPEKSLPEVRDDVRLRRAMQRALRRDAAPEYLVDSIRNMIRE